MANGFDKFIGLYTDKSIPGWIRGITWLVTIGVVVYAGRTIYVILFPPKPSGELVTVNNDISKFSATETPTYADSAYNQYADDIYNAYLYAWHEGVKGLTCYRDGSKMFQILVKAKK